MKVRPNAIVLHNDQRREIARYFDGWNNKPWEDEKGEIEGRERLATLEECVRYANLALAERLEEQEIYDHANQAEGAI